MRVALAKVVWAVIIVLVCFVWLDSLPINISGMLALGLYAGILSLFSALEQKRKF